MRHEPIMQKVRGTISIANTRVADWHRSFNAVPGPWPGFRKPEPIVQKFLVTLLLERPEVLSHGRFANEIHQATVVLVAGKYPAIPGHVQSFVIEVSMCPWHSPSRPERRSLKTTHQLHGTHPIGFERAVLVGTLP